MNHSVGVAFELAPGFLGRRRDEVESQLCLMRPEAPPATIATIVHRHTYYLASSTSFAICAPTPRTVGLCPLLHTRSVIRGAAHLPRIPALRTPSHAAQCRKCIKGTDCSTDCPRTQARGVVSAHPQSSYPHRPRPVACPCLLQHARRFVFSCSTSSAAAPGHHLTSAAVRLRWAAPHACAPMQRSSMVRTLLHSSPYVAPCQQCHAQPLSAHQACACLFGRASPYPCDPPLLVPGESLCLLRPFGPCSLWHALSDTRARFRPLRSHL
ncbi:hypothetical protein PYCCODRAFT_1244398 [Trametes coccinea BRFM310]|uniref:Uncharacterized protein n=1 Tax=Trametes coccinea (strain BRFM310) TaxID=1353009 RepID=A0A1Y2IZ61_TRAC3|nr:hypothetical protein PYCCODRAFT_1244398 [Trametes coccinea BRFM310]